MFKRTHGPPYSVRIAITGWRILSLLLRQYHAVPGSSTTLTVTDSQVSENSAVLIVPNNSDAANATVTISDGQFVVSFSPAASAGTLTYVVLG